MANANSVQSYNAVGNREDLENTIYEAFNDETPFIQTVGTAKVNNTYHEWQTVGLEAVNPENANADGFTFVNDAPRLTARVGNRTQLFSKVGEVVITQENITAAGRDNELNYQTLLAGKALMRDIEAAAVGNRASATGDAGTARKMGGFEAWLVSNTSRGANATAGGYSAGNVTAATNGTTRTFAESQIKAVMLSTFTNVGEAPSVALMGAGLKQTASSFAGNALNRIDNNGKTAITIMGAADIYQSDFGKLALTPHPYAVTRSCLLINPDMAAIGTLRPIKTDVLGKLADSDRFAMTTEKTVVVKNEKAHGLISDITA